MAEKQRTLKEPVTFKGKGLHTGVEVNMTFKPAPESHGYIFKRIDLPVLVGVKLGPARLGIGPVGSYVVKESVTSDIAELGGDDYVLFTNSMTWGFQAGLGVDISKISIDARYEGSLSKLGESFQVGNANFELDARPSQWVFSLGFWF